MDDSTNDFDSVQWRREDEEAGSHDTPQSPPSKLKSNGKRRQSSGAERANPVDRFADAVDLAGIGKGFLECTVDSPQKENDGTKDAYVSYLITTHVRRYV